MPSFDQTAPFKATRKLRRAADDVIMELRHHAAGHYPGFVYAASPRLEGEIPVFVYHTILPDEFRTHLRYLRDNDYQTITCDTYVAALRGDIPFPERAVMLTIDDGRKSVYTQAFPLLQSFGMSAVVFLIPGYMAKTSDDRAGTDLDLMSWAEVREIASTGRMDFQSHTHFHHQIPVNDEILGFVSPETKTAPFDIPVATGHEPQPPLDRRIFEGYPLFPSASRMSDRPAFLPEVGLIAALRAPVLAGGGKFFRRSDWQDQLFSIVDNWRKTHGSIGRYEKSEETTAAILESLKISRKAITDHLPNQSVRHLCLPYTLGSNLAMRCAKEAGYDSCFWGVRDDRRVNREGNDPMKSVRLKGDFLPRLPGKGRKSMATIFASKVRRRLSGALVY